MKPVIVICVFILLSYASFQMDAAGIEVMFGAKYSLAVAGMFLLSKLLIGLVSRKDKKTAAIKAAYLIAIVFSAITSLFAITSFLGISETPNVIKAKLIEKVKENNDSRIANYISGDVELSILKEKIDTLNASKKEIQEMRQSTKKTSKTQRQLQNNLLAVATTKEEKEKYVNSLDTEILKINKQYEEKKSEKTRFYTLKVNEENFQKINYINTNRLEVTAPELYSSGMLALGNLFLWVSFNKIGVFEFSIGAALFLTVLMECLLLYSTVYCFKSIRMKGFKIREKYIVDEVKEEERLIEELLLSLDEEVEKMLKEKQEQEIHNQTEQEPQEV